MEAFAGAGFDEGGDHEAVDEFAGAEAFADEFVEGAGVGVGVAVGVGCICSDPANMLRAISKDEMFMAPGV